jgi:hypothetical protein
MSKITYDGKSYELEDLRERMDEDLANGITGTVNSDQDFFDSYLQAHNDKYGERFVVG